MSRGHPQFDKMQEETVQPQPAENSGKPLEQQLAEAQAQVQTQRDAMLRAMADAENPGERFDPHRHQAIATVEAPPGEMREPNTIVSVMQKGYRLHDRVLRPALVTVAKAVEKSDGNPIS